MKIRNLRALMPVLMCLVIASCGGTKNTTLPQDAIDEADSVEFTLTSEAMVNDGDLPVTYTCDGSSISPPLQWDGLPEGTVEYALIMHHVPGPNDAHWYWLMYNIDGSKTSLNAGEVSGILGTNSMNGLNEYAPPCSAGPGVKSYTITLYALSETPDLSDSTAVDRDALLVAMTNITLDTAAMSVNFERTVTTDSNRCETIQQSITEAGFNASVGISCDQEYAYVSSETYPDHELMNGITGTNEQIPVPATNYAAPIKLNPENTNGLTSIDAALGVAVNGVPIYDYSSQGQLDVYNYDANADTVLLGQLDNCGGHAGRGDDYHYHASPTCMIDSMPNANEEPIIGWAYDGYPIYGDTNPDGSTIAQGDLEVCNGQLDDDFGYRYHTSVEPPYIVQCLVGDVDTSILPRVAPLSGDTNGARANLTPPANGVEDLTHTIADNGTRTMSYTHSGDNYYVTYTPSSFQSYCYDFEQKTVSNGGIIETGTFCREAPNDIVDPNQAHTFRLDAWADNWFAAYLGSDLIIEDSVPITTERSFNSETVTFSATYPLQVNLILKDFKQNDTGLEYIGANNQQMGDGGFIMQLTDTDTNEVVAVSNQTWKCEVLHQAPLDKSCESEANPMAGTAPCTFSVSEEPNGWQEADFDDSAWANATVHTVTAVDPKDGYNDISWDSSAEFIWGPDLETDNTLICRITIAQP